jgi:predicted amidohydrolase YtcJ
MNILNQLILSATLILLSALTFAAIEPADTVALNGKIYTVNEKQPWAEAVAIRGTDIVYVGDNVGARAFIGKNTTVGNLTGRVVLPGFIDTHMHLFPMMVFSSGLVIPNEGDPNRMLAALRTYVAENPDGPFFSFGGAFEGTVTITRQQIDAIIKDKPFLMVGQGGHGGWSNSKALEMSGIFADKKDPVDAWGRDDKGQLTGEVKTSPATWWMVKELKLIQKDSILKTAEMILDVASRNGFTTSFEAATFEGSAEAVFSAAHELEQKGKLNVRIIAGAMIQRDYNIPGAMAELKKFGPTYSSDLFNVNFMKIHGDGAPDNRTAGMLEDYKGSNAGERGFLALPPEQFKEVLLEVTGMGYDVHTHSIGDRAVRWALDGFEEVRKAGYDKVRLNTGHTMFVHEDDLPRFKQLNVGAGVLVSQGYPVPSVMAVATDAQVQRFLRIKSLIDASARVGFSAGYPLTDLNPFRNMYIAMTRKEPGSDEALPTLDETVDLATAIKSYTVDSAYMVHMEDKIGSIEVGKKADLIILDRNLFEIPVEQLPEVNVLTTMMNGKVVHEEGVDWEPPGELIQVDFCGLDHTPDHIDKVINSDGGIETLDEPDKELVY